MESRSGPSQIDRFAFLGDLRGRALLVVIGCLICQLALGYSYVFGPLASDIIREFDWSRAQYSAARAPQLFVMAAVSPLVGILVIRFGARRILLVSVFAVGCIFVLFSRLQSIWEFYGVVVLLGFALTGVGDITVGQLVTQWVKRRRGLALGLVYTGSNLAGWRIVPIAIAVAELEGWRTALLGMGLFALAVILPAAFWLAVERDAGADEVAESRDADRSGDLDLRAALRTRTFWILGFVLFSFFFYFVGMLEHLVLFLTDEGLERTDATYYYATALGFGLVSKVLLGALADYIPERSSIVLDYALLALSSLLLLFLPDAVLIWAFIFAYGFATAARDVVFPLIINHCFGERYMAEIYGGLMLGLMPGGMLGPVFAAAVYDATGSYDFAFATFAATNVIAVLALLLVRCERGAESHPVHAL